MVKSFVLLYYCSPWALLATVFVKYLFLKIHSVLSYFFPWIPRQKASLKSFAPPKTLFGLLFRQLRFYEITFDPYVECFDIASPCNGKDAPLKKFFEPIVLGLTKIIQ